MSELTIHLKFPAVSARCQGIVQEKNEAFKKKRLNKRRFLFFILLYIQETAYSHFHS